MCSKEYMALIHLLTPAVFSPPGIWQWTFFKLNPNSELILMVDISELWRLLRDKLLGRVWGLSLSYIVHSCALCKIAFGYGDSFSLVCCLLTCAVCTQSACRKILERYLRAYKQEDVG